MPMSVLTSLFSGLSITSQSSSVDLIFFIYVNYLFSQLPVIIHSEEGNTFIKLYTELTCHFAQSSPLCVLG